MRKKILSILSKRSVWIPVIVFFALLAGFYYIATYRMTRNFAVVDPNRFYRSAQLTAEELEQVVNQYGIRTVISLRGKPDNLKWMRDQEEILKRKDVKFLWFWWTSNYFPDRDEFVGFLSALRKEQYPILIHCRSGADRTGEASAIYAMDFMGVPKERAIEEQLNWGFWHITWLRPAKKELVRIYEGYDWAVYEYDPCKPQFRKYVENGHCPKL